MTRKVSKAHARYQDHPKATRRCAGCTMFVKPDACTYVMGEEDGISPDGWCRFHDPK
jgi:hypothetical protein